MISTEEVSRTPYHQREAGDNFLAVVVSLKKKRNYLKINELNNTKKL